VEVGGGSGRHQLANQNQIRRKELARAKKKIQQTRLTPWPLSAMGEPRGKGVRSVPNRVEPRPLEDWIHSIGESGLQVGQHVEVVIDPTKIQSKHEPIHGVVVTVPSKGLSVEVRFTAFGTAGNGSSSHRSFVQWLPVWKLRVLEGGSEALAFISDFDAVPGSGVHQAEVKSEAALAKGLEGVGPATHVASLTEDGSVVATHTVIGGVHVLTVFKKNGQVHVTTKAAEPKAARALLNRLAPPRIRVTEVETAQPTTKEMVAA